MLIDLLHTYKNEIIVLAWLSIGLLFISIAIIPFIVIKIPENYFNQRYRIKVSKQSNHPFVAQVFTGLKNILGFIVVVLGILMLILPGQGILTILIGLFLMNFPGKYRLERRIVSQPHILKSLNWIRSKANKAPLMVE